jgi:predicted nucleic acid-binding protein
MIAATAVVHGADLVTANVDDYRGLESDLTVIPV